MPYARRMCPGRPRRPSRTRSRRRATYGRNRKRYGGASSFRRSGWGWRSQQFTRDTLVTTLRYSTNISLDPKPENLGSTGSNVWQFSANGCYDPDTTGLGHQPMYFDNYSAVYNQYRVLKSEITVTVVNTAVNTAVYNGTTTVAQPNYNYRLFIFRDGTQGNTTDYAGSMGNMIEEGGRDIKWRFVGPSLTGKLPKLKHSAVPYKLMQLGPNDSNLKQIISSNPTASCYYYIGITSADGNTDPPAVYLYVSIKYLVRFSDRNPVQPQN